MKGQTLPFKGINWSEQLPVAVAMGKEGKSLVEIANHYGVTRQRIKQVFQQHKIDPEEVGVKLRTKKARDVRARQHWDKWGDNTQLDYSIKRQKYRAKKANARRQGVEFWIPFSEIDWPTHCPVLGIELNYETDGRKENSVSLDRIHTTDGYISGNVVVTSWRANRIKNDGSWEEHQLIADFYKNLVT